MKIKVLKVCKWVVYLTMINALSLLKPIGEIIPVFGFDYAVRWANIFLIFIGMFLLLTTEKREIANRFIWAMVLLVCASFFVRLGIDMLQGRNVYKELDAHCPYLYIILALIIYELLKSGGMKVKSLEAVSYAKHILGTGESLHGFWENAPESIRNSVMFCSNKAEEWINILNRLLHSDISKHDKDAFNWFMQHYTYDVMIGQFRRMGLIKWKKY